MVEEYKNTQLKNLNKEIWVDAFNFDGIYEVSNLGRIKSIGRWVNIRNGQRWVKERIRKQSLSKDGRLTCPFYLEGNYYSQNVSSLIFLSFNLKVTYNVKTHCVMHKNKIASDNRLSNLKIETISNSHTVNFKKNLLPHLKKNTDKLRRDYLKLTHKICIVCNTKKEINYFEYGRNTCRKCKSKKELLRYYNTKPTIK